jgi:hypothetical protein
VLGRGAAGKALLDFAERLHGGKVVLASEPERADRRRWPRLPSLKPPSRSRRGEPALTSEADG